MFKLFWVTSKEDIIELDDENYLSEELEEEIWQVALDILETPYELIILAPIAWIELEDIDLSFNKSILTIKWYRNKPEIYSDDIIVRNSECFWWKFLRNVILPENLDFDSIKASLENNLLIITISKLQFSSQNIKIDRVEI
jgi:HSP20 family molecular chaperone IbpA